MLKLGTYVIENSNTVRIEITVLWWIEQLGKLTNGGPLTVSVRIVKNPHKYESLNTSIMGYRQQ